MTEADKTKPWWDHPMWDNFRTTSKPNADGTITESLFTKNGSWVANSTVDYKEGTYRRTVLCTGQRLVFRYVNGQMILDRKGTT